VRIDAAFAGVDAQKLSTKECEKFISFSVSQKSDPFIFRGTNKPPLCHRK
jgi:hypothetical protein